MALEQARGKPGVVMAISGGVNWQREVIPGGRAVERSATSRRHVKGAEITKTTTLHDESFVGLVPFPSLFFVVCGFLTARNSGCSYRITALPQPAPGAATTTRERRIPGKTYVSAIA
jgi:hypothetical protein